MNISLEDGLVAPGWIMGQWDADVAATTRSSKNISTGCRAGKGEKVLIYHGQKMHLEKTLATCNAASFILKIYEELLP